MSDEGLTLKTLVVAVALAEAASRDGVRDGRTGYVEPIYVKPVCLACHGGNVDPGVKAKLAELYPEDQATGFREGDFRGGGSRNDDR
jgi:hypothetical protein